MFHKEYSNFVRPTSSTDQVTIIPFQTNTFLSGKEVKRIYLEEVSRASDSLPISTACNLTRERNTRKLKQEQEEKYFSDKDLFLAAQSNDVATLKDALNLYPDKISMTDDYGWSLLMIACQANSVEIVKELLNRGIDTTFRDRAGNSAQSLVIQNKNFTLADILVTNKVKNEQPTTHVMSKAKLKEKDFKCSICNLSYPDEQEHLSSTVHNINVSKGKKLPTQYVIPQTNRGFQIMLKVGWDRDSGLGPSGAGKKYPIKAVQKKDRKGLGHEKKDKETKVEILKHGNRKALAKVYESNKRMEISYRREFY